MFFSSSQSGSKEFNTWPIMGRLARLALDHIELGLHLGLHLNRVRSYRVRAPLKPATAELDVPE